jgi:hypothetical protein
LKPAALLRLGCQLTLGAAYYDEENNAGKDYSQSVVQVPSRHAEINDTTA